MVMTLIPHTKYIHLVENRTPSLWKKSKNAKQNSDFVSGEVERLDVVQQIQRFRWTFVEKGLEPLRSHLASVEEEPLGVYLMILMAGWKAILVLGDCLVA